MCEGLFTVVCAKKTTYASKVSWVELVRVNLSNKKYDLSIALENELDAFIALFAVKSFDFYSRGCVNQSTYSMKDAAFATHRN